ncbi:MAG: hypothetical protein QXY45_00835 [Candidatus Aenigmatarchaeota archaeon]
MDRNRVWSILLTGFLILLILFSSPLQAFQLSIKTSKPRYTKGEEIAITSNATIDGERLPINNVTFRISGPSGVFECTLPHNSSYIDKEIDCDGMPIKVNFTSSMVYGYGYLSGYYDGNYSWGYGYGYGTRGDMSYEIIISENRLEAGTYSVEIIYNIDNNNFSKKSTFYLQEPQKEIRRGSRYRPIIPTMKTTTTIQQTKTTTTTAPSTTTTTISTTTTTAIITQRRESPMTGFVTMVQRLFDSISRFLSRIGIKV